MFLRQLLQDWPDLLKEYPSFFLSMLHLQEDGQIDFYLDEAMTIVGNRWVVGGEAFKLVGCSGVGLLGLNGLFQFLSNDTAVGLHLSNQFPNATCAIVR